MKKQTLAAVILTGAVSLLSFTAFADVNYDAEHKTPTEQQRDAAQKGNHAVENGNSDAYIAQ